MFTVVLDTRPEAGVTVAGPFGVDGDKGVVLQPASPAVVITSGANLDISLLVRVVKLIPAQT